MFILCQNTIIFLRTNLYYDIGVCFLFNEVKMAVKIETKGEVVTAYLLPKNKKQKR